ncbi:uncharacterized protein LOC142230857 [Haematobia irritans]|uniref:uncharacterized protein LOC142230857 n=1 Tax=Haematobia irritans TaxID=7368 RepID=UPI003F4FF58C
MSLEAFIMVADDLVEFEAHLSDKQFPLDSIHSISVHKEELRSLWERVRSIYDKCLADIREEDLSEAHGGAHEEKGDDGSAGLLETIKDKYRNAYLTYCRCQTRLNEICDALGSGTDCPKSNTPSGFKLPPCEVPTFNGDYTTWPTFRDMFTAVCVKNPRLSSVEKLFHLNQSTRGEANEIVKKVPLTDENFKVAWGNLCASNRTNSDKANLSQVKSFQNTVAQPMCGLCPGEGHIIRKCPRFLEMNPNDRRMSAHISGLNNVVSASAQRECFLTLGSHVDDRFEISISALVVPQLSGSLPSRPIDRLSVTGLENLTLADPRFFESSRIDILLGGDILPSIMLEGVKLNVCGSLMAQQTVFGWILTGPISKDSVFSTPTVVSCFGEVSLDNEISRFWEVEDLPKRNYSSSSDQVCEDLYTQTTKRDQQGRFTLLRDPALKRDYDNVIEEYESLGHMSKVDLHANLGSPFHYYLPLHAVIKPESTTTKLRVVFNASASTSNGLSLNDILRTGPVLQNDLVVLILRWRFFRFVFNGDITKMYRQIKVDPKYTPYQRILFRKSPSDPIQDYELNTATFGIKCAPYLAIRTIIQLAEDNRFIYPLASDILRHSMYVDDALAGAHTIEEAVKARDQLILALRSGGFEMRKWTSNSRQIISDLPIDHLLYEEFLELNDRSTAKTLGVRWDAMSDYFYFSSDPFPKVCKYTKREVLSQISKLFDPAGWLAPCVVLAKITMQRIWIDRTQWDEVIKPESLSCWKRFQTSFSPITSIRIPRWLNYSPACSIEFHGFCDASEKAYAAAIFVRIQLGDIFYSHLLTSKTRVSPIKIISIPRLELCGAVLLAELVDNTIPQLRLKNYSIICWTDSTIVLSWLARPPCYWATFVANRVTKIIEVVDSTKWRHVRSEDNPADLASRGVYPQELVGNHLWWHGPEWLRHPSHLWPESPISDNGIIEIEKKPVKVHFSFFDDFEDVLNRFSCYSRAVRVIAYIYRFYYSVHSKLRSNSNLASLSISSFEIQMVQKSLIVMTQRAYFPRLDFAGPFEIKNYSGRNCRMSKGYVCIFICFCIKAIHLEATSDLSTSAFLAAFSRFVSRRGCPLNLYSDNGTTFVGASKVLSKQFHTSTHEAVTAKYAHHNLTWHFIPPGAPHMGGLWEAGVKSFKLHFKKVAGNFKHTFEEFQTLLYRIEACSRPLSPISPDPSYLVALTLGHFLIGSPILAPIDPNIRDTPMSISNRWERLKAIHQHLCARWKEEYLKKLHKRYKWQKTSENLEENMLVVVREENLPPNVWRLGRITRVYPGNDGRIRVADVRTERGIITRPITKLVVLPSESTS